MRVKDRQNKPAPKNHSYCVTEWARVIHLTSNGNATRCGNVVAMVLTNDQALNSPLNICHGCFPTKF